MLEKSAPKSRLNAHDRRASIIDAAVKMFSEKGFRGTTTRELAAAVGVSEPVLYEHFKTKRELYTAIIETKSQDGLVLIKELTDQFLGKQDDCGFFTSLAQLIFDWHLKNPEYIRLMLFSCLEGHELKEIMHERVSGGFLGIVSNYIRCRIDQGAMRDVNPELFALIFTGTVAQYSQSALLVGATMWPISHHEAIGSIVDIMLNGMLAVEPTHKEDLQ